MRSLYRRIYTSVAAAILLSASANFLSAQTHLFNVSYDPTREFYEEYDHLFAQHWKATTSKML